MSPESVLRAVLAGLARWAVRHPLLALRVVLAAPLVCGGLLLAGVGMALRAEGLRTVEIRQCDWGHGAQKRTWLLLSRVQALPPFPTPQKPTRYIDTPDRYKRQGDLFSRGPQHVPKSRRHLTPPAFAAWLVEAARSARSARQDREQDRQDDAPAGPDAD